MLRRETVAPSCRQIAHRDLPGAPFVPRFYPNATRCHVHMSPRGDAAATGRHIA